MVPPARQCNVNINDTPREAAYSQQYQFSKKSWAGDGMKDD